MKNKLTLLLLISIFIFGCKESNPHLGKWLLSIDGENAVIEILEGGNWLSHDSDGIETGQWFATDGGIVIDWNGQSLTAFVHEDSLVLTEEDETHTLKRVK